MKKFQVLTLLGAVGLLAAVLPAGATPVRNGVARLSQQSSQQATQSQQQSQPQQAEPQQSQQQQVFTGTMVKKGGQYLFVDDANKATHQLDHQQELSKYQLDGKKVQIEGTLDAANNIIHITRIALLHSKG